MYRNATGVSGERTRLRVLVAAPSLQRTSRATGAASLEEEKSRDDEDVIASTRGAYPPRTGLLRADRYTSS
jgi:hypothetical protein